MEIKEVLFGNKKCFMIENESDSIVIQPIDSHDFEEIENEWKVVSKPFTLIMLPIVNWNYELSPWTHEAVFGKEGFGDGAKETLDFIINEMIPSLPSNKKFYLAGYSLAGLFALWASYQVSSFEGIVAASPSMWFHGFLDYTKENSIQTKRIYLSLGDKEEFTKNPIMKTVGDHIRSYASSLEKEIPCVLEWNQGNHFKDSGMRVGKGIEWIL